MHLISSSFLYELESFVFYNITNIQAKKHDIEGTSTVTHLIYSLESLNYGNIVIVNNAIPLDNLSTKE